MWFPPPAHALGRSSAESGWVGTNQPWRSPAGSPFPSELRPMMLASPDVDVGDDEGATIVVEGERPGPDISLENIFPDGFEGSVFDLLWPWGGGPGGGGIGGGPAPDNPDHDKDGDGDEGDEDDGERERPKLCWDEACAPFDWKWFAPDDGEEGDGLPAPPDRPNPQPPDYVSVCSDAEKSVLDRAVGHACKNLPPHSCSTDPEHWLSAFPSIRDRCDKIRENINTFDRCLTARRARADMCFGGTLDERHLRNWDSEAKGRSKCVEMWNHPTLGCT